MSKRNLILTLMASSLSLTACGGGSTAEPFLEQQIIEPSVFPVNETVLSDGTLQNATIEPDRIDDTTLDLTATYQVSLENYWGVENFPQNFPDAAHLSLIGGATHNAAVSFWEEGEIASRGIEDVAEAGLIDILLFNEVSPAIANGTAKDMIEVREFTAPQIDGIPGVSVFEIEMGADWPLVSMITMLGPSPDWFVGLSGESLMRDGNWISELVVDLPLYDGGSKSDITPIMGGPDIIPPNPISLVAYDVETGVYLPTDDPQIVARVTFERIDSVPVVEAL